MMPLQDAAASSRIETLVGLLHASVDAALATHSAAMPGYPFATAVPFATDEHHRPLLLISRLAEHTQNLAADPRASLMVSRQLGAGEMARVSLVGEVVAIDAGALLVARYLRFHPAAERFLQLGDFGFHRFETKRVRIVGGFGKAGWLDGARLFDVPAIDLADEQRLLDEATPRLPPSAELLGVDGYGCDLRVNGQRVRHSFAEPAATPAAAAAALAAAMPDIAAQGGA
jgi:hypothetical protein